MRILSLILLSAVAAYGAEKPVCDANAVTRNCKFFEERKDQPKIKLADGSYLPNPMVPATFDPNNNPYAQYGAANGGGGLGGGSYVGYAPISIEDQEAAQVNQAEILDQLAKVPASTLFKMNFAAYAGLYAANPDVAIMMVWPPDTKNPEKTPIKGSVMFDYLKSKMKAADYAQLMKLVDVQKDKAVKATLAMQEQQKAQLAAAQKRQEEALAESQRLDARKKRIPELFKYAQEQMIALLRQGRKDADLSPELLRQIEKIKTVKLHDVNDPQTPSSSTCAAGLQQNAFYMPSDHDVTICPGFYNKSDAELVSIMAHEMGHSIDGCNSQFPLISVNKEKISELQNSKELTDTEKSSLGYLKAYGDKLLNMDLKMSYSPALTEKFLKLGVLKEEVKGSDYKKYPQIKELECLASSAGFRINEASDINNTKRVMNRTTTHMPPEEKIKMEAIYDRYGKAMDQYPQCFGTLKGASQAVEFTSDLFGALVLEKYFMDYPPKSEEEKVASVQLWIRNACAPNGPVINHEITADQVSPQVLSGIMNSQVRFHNHPDDSRRLKNIYLNLPGTAKLFDCKREEKACFDHLSFYNRAGSKQKSSMDSKQQEGAQ